MRGYAHFWHPRAASLSMEMIVDLHQYVMTFLIVILTVVVITLAQSLLISDEWFRRVYSYGDGLWLIRRSNRVERDRQQYRKRVHSLSLELIWTIIPSIILFVIALPSMFVLYLIDEHVAYILTVFKVIGHQWYWSYEVAETSSSGFLQSNGQLPFGVSFDSYMVPTEMLELGELRLLEVDNTLIVPIETPVSFIVTSTDVLHSWAVPALGIKVDAVPGRLNQAYLFGNQIGEFHGQCSELCGINHGFMPIKLLLLPARG